MYLAQRNDAFEHKERFHCQPESPSSVGILDFDSIALPFSAGYVNQHYNHDMEGHHLQPPTLYPEDMALPENFLHGDLIEEPPAGPCDDLAPIPVISNNKFPAPPSPIEVEYAFQMDHMQRECDGDNSFRKRQRRASLENLTASMKPKQKMRRFRPYQAEQWQEKFDELYSYYQKHGHCSVPHTFPPNPALARWVKRQRYQYKLMTSGQQSTMTRERVKALEDIGFVWDSHGQAWEDRLRELRDYRQAHGDCNVPSNYPPNPQLATWVKCQRRQYKLYWEGSSSNMTLERISDLEKIGFEWELRGPKNAKRGSGDDMGDYGGSYCITTPPSA
jgi:hypothetical protein